jgi:tetratricopeptide (TPR) repeat protein
LDSFIASSAKHWAGFASRARVEIKLGLNEKAVADFRAALLYNPAAGPDLVQEAAQALATNGLTNESVSILEKALSRSGPIPSLQMKIVEIEVAASRYDSALGHLDSFQQSARRTEPWVARRASILAQAGRVMESRAAWKSLVDHIQKLPLQERDSHSMTLLHEQAREALSLLAASNRSNPIQP